MRVCVLRHLRLQTAEEQRELLQMEKQAEQQPQPTMVKEELDALAADALKAASEHTKLESVPVIQYMRWGQTTTNTIELG